MKLVRFRHAALALAVCIIAPLHQSAYAQRGASGDAEEIIEEILVTASKRGATSLLDTAVTATVVTGDQLEYREIRNVDDLQAQAPGVVVDAGRSTPIFAIRGIGHDAFLTSAESGVAMYANDIVLARPFSMSASFFDLERVDVLKGPQGTSFGRNATGGSVNFISRGPEQGTYAEVGGLYGSFDRSEFHGIFNYGTPEWGVRIAAKFNEDDGYGENLTTGQDLGAIDSTVVKASISFTPTDAFEAILRVDYTDDESSNPVGIVQAAEPFSVPAFFGTALSLDLGEDYEANHDQIITNDLEATQASLHLDWDIGELHLRSITGYLESDRPLVVEADFTDLPLVQTDMKNEGEQFSQEFVLSGTAGSFDWLTGAYFLREEHHLDLAITFFEHFDPAGGVLLGDDTQDTTSWAAFGSGTWHINDQTRLTAGVRYTEDEKEMDYNQSFRLGSLSPAPGFEAPTCVTTVEETWDDVTWDLTLERELSADSFGYVKVNAGFKAGGVDALTCEIVFDPEELTAYEIGYKGTFRDGKMTLATSAFYYDYSDMQISQVLITPEGLPATQTLNSGKSELYGLDIEFRALLTNQFSVDLALSWLPTAEYEEFSKIDEQDFRIFTGAGIPDPLDLSGHRLNRAPEYSGTAGLNFNSELGGNWSMDARVELYFVDDIAFSPFDRPNAYNVSIGITNPEQKDTNIQKAYELVNAYLGFHYGDSWTIRAYGKNLTDEYYITGVVENSVLGGPFTYLARPREAGVQVIYRFAN